MNTEDKHISVVVITALTDIPTCECCRQYYEKTKRYPDFYQKKYVRACFNN
jgi:hypothetical protein